MLYLNPCFVLTAIRSNPSLSSLRAFKYSNNKEPVTCKPCPREQTDREIIQSSAEDKSESEFLTSFTRLIPRTTLVPQAAFPRFPVADGVFERIPTHRKSAGMDRTMRKAMHRLIFDFSQ